MEQYNELTGILQKYFNSHKSRIICLTNMISALINTRTVNLVRLSHAFPGDAEHASKYKRLQRFLNSFQGLSIRYLAQFMSNFLPKGVWQLSMDRTNWKWGKRDINILMLSANLHHISVPVCWIFLNKRGNSSQDERIKLIEDFIEVYGQERFGELLADREFVSGPWFEWLISKGIFFTIRVKKNLKVESLSGEITHIFKLFRIVKSGKSRALKTQYQVLGVPLWLAMHRSKNEYVIVVTTQVPKAALERYKRRWNIETLFGFLKTKGFNFEDTHITEPKRLHNLLSVLAIAFIWSYHIGLHLVQKNPVKLKKHGRHAKSIFRVGLDHLSKLCRVNMQNIQHVAACILDNIRKVNLPEVMP